MNVEPRLSTFAKLLSGFSSPKNLDVERFLKKCYSFYIFPCTKVFDNLGQNDNQYHKEEAVSCQWSGHKIGHLYYGQLSTPLNKLVAEIRKFRRRTDRIGLDDIEKV